METEIWRRRKFRLKVEHIKRISDRDARKKFLVYANSYWNVKDVIEIFSEYLYFDKRGSFCDVLIELLKGKSKIRADVLAKFKETHPIYTYLNYIGCELIEYGTVSDIRVIYRLMHVDDFNFLLSMVKFASKPSFRYLFQLLILDQYLMYEPRKQLIEDIVLHENIKRDDVIWMAKNLKCHEIYQINGYKVAKKYNADDFALIMDWVHGVNNMNFDS